MILSLSNISIIYAYSNLKEANEYLYEHNHVKDSLHSGLNIKENENNVSINGIPTSTDVYISFHKQRTRLYINGNEIIDTNDIEIDITHDKATIKRGGDVINYNSVKLVDSYIRGTINGVEILEDTFIKISNGKMYKISEKEYESSFNLYTSFSNNKRIPYRYIKNIDMDTIKYKLTNSSVVLVTISLILTLMACYLVGYALYYLFTFIYQ